SCYVYYGYGDEDHCGSSYPLTCDCSGLATNHFGMCGRPDAEWFYYNSCSWSEYSANILSSTGHICIVFGYDSGWDEFYYWACPGKDNQGNPRLCFDFSISHSGAHGQGWDHRYFYAG
ncbi:hypothetical protein ACFL6H_10355, partial [Candidatus Latescibacterota bacterium]